MEEDNDKNPINKKDNACCESSSPCTITADDYEEKVEGRMQVVVGVCAMAKKSLSKPMKEILTRLQEFELLRVEVFPEEVILQRPVEEWPVCDCLVSFHSRGFPLDKAIAYTALRSPFIINNLHMQYDIQARRKVYAILEGEGIQIPRYAVLDRNSPDPNCRVLIEAEDHVEVNGVVFNKPFVEKPLSAEDHNIFIYYPSSAGGGSQRLFRKIGSRSSVYSPESHVRKTGSFIYEDFMPTDGTDVKVYTVGPDYAHAEARKSPALDGKVERDAEGKEIRYPVILSNAEKLISRKVCLAFKQTVCGFDLLRANGKSFVCDVNGFSFVKNSNKYYDDCAKILGNMILRELAPTLHIPWSVPFQLDDPPIVPTTFGKMMELRCLIGVIRHGDRTPKQKMKLEVRHPKFFEVFNKYRGDEAEVKLKSPAQLQEILDVTRSLLAEVQQGSADAVPELRDKQGKLEQLRNVLEMYGYFSGINRKVQMKYHPNGWPKGHDSDDPDTCRKPSLLLILKWGGELTPAGRTQAEQLGRMFRCMYPGGQGDYAGTQGLGLLRLHSTFRHDLKIYASDEGRVQMTAAAFAKGLLALEGELTPILVQMVKSANTDGLLDNDCDASKVQSQVKEQLHSLMHQDHDFTAEDRARINPCGSLSVAVALDYVKNPFRCCQEVHAIIQRLVAAVNSKSVDPATKDIKLYNGETWELMGRRWGKIERDFYDPRRCAFDISKVPDIYDCIKYDLQHNQRALKYDFNRAEELYMRAKYLADVVVPQEYGLTIQEKLVIAQGICTPLLKKIKADLQRNIEEFGEDNVNRLNPRYSHGVSSPGRHVRTRLYFTSESHVHSLITMLRFGGLVDAKSDEQWRRAMEYISMVSEFNYMSQIVIMLYEDPTKDVSSEDRFHVELHFSPGVNCCVQKNFPPGPGFRPHRHNDSARGKDSDYPSSSENPTIPEEVSEKVSRVSLTSSEPDLVSSSRLSASPGCVGQQVPSSVFRTYCCFGMQGEEYSNRGGSNRRGPVCRRLPSPGAQPGSGSTSSLFSTAVISGVAPALRSFLPDSLALLSASAALGATPRVRPLETLHNALSLRRLDSFLTAATTGVVTSKDDSWVEIKPVSEASSSSHGIDGACAVREGFVPGRKACAILPSGVKSPSLESMLAASVRNRKSKIPTEAPILVAPSAEPHTNAVPSSCNIQNISARESAPTEKSDQTRESEPTGGSRPNGECVASNENGLGEVNIPEGVNVSIGVSVSGKASTAEKGNVNAEFGSPEKVSDFTGSVISSVANIQIGVSKPIVSNTDEQLSCREKYALTGEGASIGGSGSNPVEKCADMNSLNMKSGNNDSEEAT